jgi:hypothetical protein
LFVVHTIVDQRCFLVFKSEFFVVGFWVVIDRDWVHQSSVGFGQVRDAVSLLFLRGGRVRSHWTFNG